MERVGTLYGANLYTDGDEYDAVFPDFMKERGGFRISLRKSGDCWIIKDNIGDGRERRIGRHAQAIGYFIDRVQDAGREVAGDDEPDPRAIRDAERLAEWVANV
jgi:hypothetical protein